MSRVLVFGGTGFVGTYIAQRYINEGHEVAVFSRSEVGCHQGMKIYTGDIAEYSTVEEVIRKEQPNIIYNCAAVLTRGINEADKELSSQVNERGSNNIVDAIALLKQSGTDSLCAGVFLGTSMEYGVGHTPPLRESAECHPVGIYAESKFKATNYLQTKAREYKLPLVSARVFTPYGLGMNQGSLIMKSFTRIKNGQVPVLSNPSVTRDFIYIDDLVNLLVELAEVAEERLGEVFNCGSGVATTLQDYVIALRNTLPFEGEVMWDASLQSIYDTQVWQADMQKTFAVVKDRPKITLQEGLRKLAEGL